MRFVQSVKLVLITAILLVPGGAAVHVRQASAQVADIMRSWDACEVFDDFAPLRDYFDMYEIRTPTGEFIAMGWGEGADAEATTCSGRFSLAVTNQVTGEMYKCCSGEVWLSLSPWESVELAKDDFDARAFSGAMLPMTRYATSIDIPVGDWDEVVCHEESMTLDFVLRKDHWNLDFALRIDYTDGLHIEMEHLRGFIVESVLPAYQAAVVDRLEQPSTG
ncbi:hypothetical protein O1R50_18470 [Glycomyces luteolus]|uniref:Uncharacterized protein n=1 Tax=Glycomyces luteolus TaxID=2670330 RepID=A0A9X3SSV9_9ACTN|nr:hypothetical protein [Glycomyces luteolus]MDA1361619.1 hypothetical protein [Glycomyces luteolus]